MFRRAEERFGRIDIVHNNAGLATSVPQWPDIPIERVAALADVNLKGVLLGTRLAIDAMRRSGGGVIVNTASVAAHNPSYGEAIYGTTKAAVVFFTRACEGLKAAHNIRVNAVCPGITDTPLLNKTGDGSGPAEWLGPALARVVLIPPEAIAEAVLDLIRDDSKVAEIVTVQNQQRDVPA
jgi:3-oxoacyl-[acyl-carrier protein] reductase